MVGKMTLYCFSSHSKLIELCSPTEVGAALAIVGIQAVVEGISTVTPRPLQPTLVVPARSANLPYPYAFETILAMRTCNSYNRDRLLMFIAGSMAMCHSGHRAEAELTHRLDIPAQRRSSLLLTTSEIEIRYRMRISRMFQEKFSNAK